MDSNRYKQVRRQSQQSNIDGFILPVQKQRITQLPLLKQPQPLGPATDQEPYPRPVSGSPNPPAYQTTNESNDPNRSWLNTSRPATYQSASQEPRTKKTPKKFTKKKIMLRSALLILILFLGVGGYLGVKGLNTLNKVFHGNILSDATAAFNESPLKGESSGRVNILLAGDSADDPNHAGAILTDSILLLSIDTQNHTAFLLSVPRDLWVYVPGLSSYQKINAANSVTNFSAPNFPSGGMGQLEQIIQTQLDIPIDYFGLMDYGAFKDSVNAVGGITTTIQSPDPRGLYDINANLKLPNGPVTLDGQQALDLARARGDGYGSYGFTNADFDRTAHQRQLFLAVAAKAKSIGVLTNPVKVSNLFNALGNNFQTDLSLQNVLRLIQITKDINLNSIQSYSLLGANPSTAPLLSNYTDPASGEEALIPSTGIGDYGELQQYYQQLTSNNPVVKEGPSVVLLNASNVTGLASKERSILEAKGFNVSAIADANSEYSTTMVVDNTNNAKPNSLKLLQKLYPGTTATSTTASSEASEATNYTADFVVVLGQNWQSATQSAN
jgi:LCP family protein required for cell wall assembly